MAEVSVVIVCMNRPDNLYPCLESLLAQNKTSMEIFVVAYMFSEDNLKRLAADYPGIRIIRSDSLQGFSENNNLALRQVSTEFTLILNDDTLQDAPVVDALVRDMRTLPGKVAAVSPKIVFADGRVQTCGRAPWTAWRWMKHYLHIEDETAKGPWTMREGLFQTYTLNGACFLARTHAFREAGWFDEKYTFTPEDIALGHKFNEMGYEVYADADVSITHLAGSTASRMEAAIKPTRIKGSLLLYSNGSKVKYFLLGIYACAIESLRYLKYVLRGCGSEHDRIMKATARNVIGAVFSKETTKEVFLRYYNELSEG